MEDNRIIVSGGGPVGMTGALILARAGLPVTLIESSVHPEEDLRASTFHPPTLDMLGTLGLTELLLPQGLIADKYQYRSSASGRYAVFDLGVLKDLVKHPFRLQCEQFKLSRTVLAMLREMPNVDVQMGTTLTSVSDGNGGVTVGFRTVAGQEGKLEGRYLIGADGARSAVRKSLTEVEFEGFTYPEMFLVVSTRYAVEKDLPGLSYVNYVSDPEEWCTILRVPEFWRILFPADPEAPDDAATRSDVTRRMQRLSPDFRQEDIAHLSFYRVHQRVATKYRVGNVFLAGDAAHINNPLGGMGMNGGLHDIFSLTEKLISVIKDGEADTLLDRYERQRRQITVDFIQAQTIANKAAIEENDGAKREQRIDDLQAVAADVDRSIAFLRRNSMIDSLQASQSIL